MIISFTHSKVRNSSSTSFSTSFIAYPTIYIMFGNEGFSGLPFSIVSVVLIMCVVNRNKDPSHN